MVIILRIKSQLYKGAYTNSPVIGVEPVSQLFDGVWPVIKKSLVEKLLSLVPQSLGHGLSGG